MARKFFVFTLNVPETCVDSAAHSRVCRTAPRHTKRSPLSELRIATRALQSAISFPVYAPFIVYTRLNPTGSRFDAGFVESKKQVNWAFACCGLEMAAAATSSHPTLHQRPGAQLPRWSTCISVSRVKYDVAWKQNNVVRLYIFNARGELVQLPEF